MIVKLNLNAKSLLKFIIDEQLNDLIFFCLIFFYYNKRLHQMRWIFYNKFYIHVISFLNVLCLVYANILKLLIDYHNYHPRNPF